MPGSPSMANEVTLSRIPTRSALAGRHADVAEPQFFVQKVEVVVQALAVLRLQICLAGFPVVPRLVGGARFHGREDAHQAGLFAPLRQDLFDAVFLAEVFLANVLDLDAVVSRQLLGVLPQSVPEGLGEAWIVENPDLVL